VVLSVIETSLLLGLAYGIAYGGWWLFHEDFGSTQLWRVAGWCLVGLFGTGAIGAWVLINQVWIGQSVGDPLVFAIATLAIGAAGGVL
jgi:hypothetical protein